MRVRSGRVFTVVIVLLIYFSSAVADDALKQRLHAVSKHILNEQNGVSSTKDKQEIDFREQRYSELLAEPTVFSGKLVYEPVTRTMSKVVTQPDNISMSMTEKAVVIESSAGKRRLSLRARPALRAILAGFRALVEGDVEALQSYFEIEYENNNDNWQLFLTPSGKRLARRLTSLTISGQDKQVNSIVTIMTNGDRQHMTLTPVATVNE